MRSELIAAFGLAALVGGGDQVYAHIEPLNVCKETKARATGQKALDLLTAHGRHSKRPNTTKLTADVSKAQSRFTRAFTTAEARGRCRTSGDVAAIEAKVDAFVDGVIADVFTAGPAVCGNNVLDFGEQCDASAPSGESACPTTGQCLPPALVLGDPECTCFFDPTPAAARGFHRASVRPAAGGNSVLNAASASCLAVAGFRASGTLGAIVFPTAAPADPYILGNSHVLGRQSDHDPTTTDDRDLCVGTPETTAGEPVMQPGTLDGGAIAGDEVGVLPPFVLADVPPSLDPYEPLCFPTGYCPGAPGFPPPLCNGGACVDAYTENCIDAAIAKLTVPAAIPPPGTAAVLDIGPNVTFGAPIGPPTCKDADVDSSLIDRVVKKSGRTTGLTWGYIVGIVDVFVSYGAGLCSGSGNRGESCLEDTDCPVPEPGACVLVDTGYEVPPGNPPLFANQLLIRANDGGADFSRPGDSGSIIFTGSGDEPVGLLFAGGSGSTIANPIRPVLSRFGVGF
jgi:hypothetical protein